jgi:hypothetical protein
MQAWRIEWTFAAKAMLRSIPWRDAARVDEAVMRLAATGQGDIDRITGDPHGAWLRLAGYSVRMELEPREHQLTVLYVWRSGG